MSKIYYPKNTIYYVCSDSLCQARLKVIYGFDLQKDADIKNVNNTTNVKLTKEHTLSYNEHNFYINNIIKNDLKTKTIKVILRKMSDLDYLIKVIKQEGINNRITDSSGNELFNYISNKYNNIKIDYNKINENSKFFKKEFAKFKIENKTDFINNDSLKKIVTVKNICSKINTYLCHYFNKNKNLSEQLLSLKYNNKIISEDDIVTFIRKNKTYEKKNLLFYDGYYEIKSF